MKSHYRGEKEVTQCTNWCYNKLRARNKYTIFKGKKCKFYSDRDAKGKMRPKLLQDFPNHFV